MNSKVFHAVSYGLYVIGVASPKGPTGCVVNTVFQLTSKPAVFAVSVNKQNHTHDCIRAEGLFAVTALKQTVEPGLIGLFGFHSGRDVDKNADGALRPSPNGLPVLAEGGVAYMEFAVSGEVDAGTHTLFLCRLFGGDVLSADEPLTYGYYQTVLKGKSPKLAPTYREAEAAGPAAPQPEPQAAAPQGAVKYVCSICGYVYDGDVPFADLPDDWTCPVCGVTKDMFEPQPC